MGFNCGIIGLPNVGKSTIFNALTSGKAEALNFPFCTINPNTGAVPVPDLRLEELAAISKSEKIVPTQMTFVDIAGLIKGASKGEGLGNQFLGHIREVDAILHIIRTFEASDIVHVDGGVDPIRDIETIETELLLSDIDSMEKQVEKLEKMAKVGDKESRARLEIGKEILKSLSDGNLAVQFKSPGQEELAAEFKKMLLTSKPVLLVGNLSENDIQHVPSCDGNTPIDRLFKYAQEKKRELLLISGKIESEISQLKRAERKEYLDAVGLSSSGLERLTIAGYRLLGLLTFFTSGPKETRAWTVVQGTKAPQAAGKIHTDFERGFIRAEVISFDDYIEGKGEVGAREKGKLRVEGKDYTMKDGDVVHFRFNV